MTVCIFTGPTLPPAAAAKVLDAEYLPPAAIGDVYQAAQRQPWAIGIIDGFFESTPSVWHKEVLWAMAQGIHVFGASSMGALRAAELEAFGVVGVGTIFEAYRDGEIEDDDEVAVVHGPPELGYVQVSEALVNIRATMRQATAAAVLAPATASALIDLAKSLYYKQRTYDRLLDAAAGLPVPAGDLERLRAWLPDNQVNQKRLDAIAMLEAIARQHKADPAPKTVSYKFERTMLWDAVERQYGASDGPSEDSQRASLADDLLQELRLDPRLHERTLDGALLRSFLRGGVDAPETMPTVSQMQAATRRFAEQLGLTSPAQLEAWMRGQDLDREDFLRLMDDAARRHALAASCDPQALLDELRANGDYARLRERIRRKST